MKFQANNMNGVTTESYYDTTQFQANDDELTFLTLGDGDFTYSLDLARCLGGWVEYYSDIRRNKIHLISTGIDTKSQLVAKYKDALFVLEQLQQQQSSSSSTSTPPPPLLSVSIRHGVNAIVTSLEQGGNQNSTPFCADHVMFHHPHLGTEDAQLHGRFLCHLMESINKYWMKRNGGIFHLTLVQGQFERWKCQEAAERQGLKLLKRVPFEPPPIPTSSYRYRRHQTGKSFESRRPMNGSETFTFGRTCDEGKYIAHHLPWQGDPDIMAAPDSNSKEGNSKFATKQDPSSNKNNDINSLPCPFCERHFREERSRKCHIRDKHPEGADKKQKTDDDDDDSMTKKFQCEHCPPDVTTGESRSFLSEQALKDHVRAKHSAIHRQILPDWHRPTQVVKQQNSVTTGWESVSTTYDSFHKTADAGDRKDHGCCSICGLVFVGADHSDRHQQEFIPPDDTFESFQCSFCSKSFREKRAKLQHENFCSRQVYN